MSANRCNGVTAARLALAALAAGSLAACAGGGRKAESRPTPAAAASTNAGSGIGRNASQAVGAARSTTFEGVPGAATAPLEDLNITREDIPESLQFEYVYGAYPPPTCDGIAAEITALDQDLGRDYDQEAQEKKSLGYRGGEAVGDLVVDTIRGVTTDIIPFRSAVREVSGAASAARKRSRAFAAGYARRAYLKGLALGQGCEPPAAPRVIVPPSQNPQG